MDREEAVEIIRKNMPSDKSLPVYEALRTLVPELEESEDERMINELQGFLISFGSDYFGSGEWQKFDDWLEKQKEQKPAEWSEEDEDAIRGAIGILLDDNNPNFVFPEHSKLSVGEIVKRLKSLPERFNLEPKPEWSEEDEKQIRQIERIVKDAGCSVKLQEQIHNWLKSLKSSWKPTDEQIKAIRLARSFVVDDFSEKPTLSETLKELEEQLKKLM